MKRTIRDAIIEAKFTEEMINTFIVQIGIYSIVGGLYLHSWIVFGLLLLFPLAMFLLSKNIGGVVLSRLFYVLYMLLSGVLLED